MLQDRTVQKSGKEQSETNILINVVVVVFVEKTKQITHPETKVCGCVVRIPRTPPSLLTCANSATTIIFIIQKD